MAVTNADRVGKMLETLTRALVPYVEREYEARYGERWVEELVASVREARIDPSGRPSWDAQALLTAMMNRWNEVFRAALGRSGQSYVGELREFRNQWAHQQAISSVDTERAMDTAARLLTAISAPESDEIERQRQDLRRLVYEEQTRREVRKASVAPIEGQSMGGLRPWREIVTPHPDVASGRFQQAEFAADLWQVYVGEGASEEYADPVEFFRRTYLTEGLRGLLVGSLRRLWGEGGDPVVELQTNFGGGKTHSMLALYHLFSGVHGRDLPGIEPVLQEAEALPPSGVKRAVLVGTKLSPGQPTVKPDGTTVRTLWGELAYQLGGREGFELVRLADETGTNPGDALRILFTRYSPCLVLVDEWVAYARQLHDDGSLPGGSFGAHFTFAQALTEAAKAAPKTMLVVSIPASDSRASDIEVGGSRGQQALERLKNVIGRTESAWRPASGDESFEIVRRRLFQPIADPALFPQRDAVVRAFMELYRSNPGEFPSAVREGEYERRLKAAYPIHPELFERLYTDWSTLAKFQRTRGVLRLMASVIHQLWEREDRNLLILPAHVPIDAGSVQSELTRYMDDPWVPVIEKDVDGPDSLPLRLDRENPNLGKYSACRRVARTLYLGSAPTLHAENRGIEDNRIKLGCVQPGEPPAVFGDALRRLTDQANHLYVNGQRYWFSTQPSVTRLAQDRAEGVTAERIEEEIRKRLADALQARADFGRVHVSPSSSNEVLDQPDVALVAFGPRTHHSARSDGSPARVAAAEFLEKRGAGPRYCRNALVFLSPDKTRLGELEDAARAYLAWKSIERDAQDEVLNFDTFQRNQAVAKSREADKTLDLRLPEAYQWVLVPAQPEPNGPVEWEEVRVSGPEPLASRVAKKLKTDGHLAVSYAGTLLRRELDRIPLWRGDHVSLKLLVDSFASYLYLPRLKGPEVIADAIREGLSLLTWSVDTFAYADRWDAEKGRYEGLRVGGTFIVDSAGAGLVVKPEVAIRQIESERSTIVVGPGGTDSRGRSTPPIGPTGGGGGGPTLPLGPKKLTRFHGSKRLDPERLVRDAGEVANEILQHLLALGADVQVTLEIQARIPDGAPDGVVRTVTENCSTLKFTSGGFEPDA